MEKSKLNKFRNKKYKFEIPKYKFQNIELNKKKCNQKIQKT